MIQGVLMSCPTPKLLVCTTSRWSGDEFKAVGGGDFNHGQPAVRDITVAALASRPSGRVLDVDDDAGR